MMEVIKEDFARTVREIEAAEKEAEDDHREFIAATAASVSEKEVIEEDWKNQQETQSRLSGSANNDLDLATDTLKSQIDELKKLQHACVNTGMTYEERVERREEEIKALKQALCIFESHSNGGTPGECSS